MGTPRTSVRYNRPERIRGDVMAKGATMAIYKSGGHATVELGGLRFEVMHRSLGEDGGPTIEVYGDVDGKATQVLRFDCFRKAPHYHHAPMGKNINTSLDPAKFGDGQEFAMTQIREHIPEMLRTAGFDALAQKVDARALRGGWTKVKEAVEGTAPKVMA